MLSITKASTGVVTVLVILLIMLLAFGVVGPPAEAVQVTMRIKVAALKVASRAFMMWVPALPLVC